MFTKEQLIEMGISAETADKIVAANKKMIDEGFVTKSRFNELNESKTQLQKSVVERDEQLDKLTKSAGASEELKSQIESLKAENAKKEADYKNELRELKVGNSIETALLTAKAKNLVAARALIDRSKVVVSEDGTIHGIEEQIKALSETEDTKFLFGEAKETTFKGAKPAPGGEKDLNTQKGQGMKAAIAAYYENKGE